VHANPLQRKYDHAVQLRKRVSGQLGGYARGGDTQFVDLLKSVVHHHYRSRSRRAVRDQRTERHLLSDHAEDASALGNASFGSASGTSRAEQWEPGSNNAVGSPAHCRDTLFSPRHADDHDDPGGSDWQCAAYYDHFQPMVFARPAPSCTELDQRSTRGQQYFAAGQCFRSRTSVNALSAPVGFNPADRPTRRQGPSAATAPSFTVETGTPLLPKARLR